MHPSDLAMFHDQFKQLAAYLLGTDDDLEVGQSELGRELPFSERQLRKHLAFVGRVKQCPDCAVWYRLSSKRGCTECRESFQNC